MSSIITAEERARWQAEAREFIAEDIAGGLISPQELLRLLNALETAEVRARGAEPRLNRALHVASDTDGDSTYYYMWALELRDRAEKAEAENKALRHLVNCHDNYLTIVDKTTAVPPAFLRLEAARASLEELERGNNER